MTVLLVFAFIVLIAGAVMAVIGRVDFDGDPFNFRPMGVGLLLVAVLMAAGSTIRDVGAREVGVPVTFGHIGADMPSGIHFANPFTKVTTCPVSQQADIQNAAATSGSSSANEAVAISGSDAGLATADVTVLYNITDAGADTAYIKYKCNIGLIQSNLVAQLTRSAVAQASTAYLTIDLRSDRTAIQDAAKKALTTELAPDGIAIDQVTIGDLILTQPVQDAAQQQLLAQQGVVTAGYAKKKAVIDAQTAVIKAQGVAAAQKAQQASNTPQALCAATIQAVAAAHPSVISSWGVCSTITPASSTPVIVNGSK
jgi:regulator of protease activity HflC (stomatin/prohibitin superfamily)